MAGICEWPIDRGCWPQLCSDIDLARMQAAADAAVNWLWEKTGRRFGYCPVIVRPCPKMCAPSMAATMSQPWFPVWENGSWRNVVCGCGASCTRSGPGVIHLPGPVYAITRVTFAGVEQNPAEYFVEGDYLYRSECRSWPSQNLQCPLDVDGTWAVEYMKGYAPPAGAATAVGQLALEFFKACGGDKSCRLPARVQSIVRQGVSIKIIDTTELSKEGLTGIPEVDLFVRTWNPNGIGSTTVVL